MLLRNDTPRFLQTTSQAVLIDFLQMPVPKKAMQRETRFANMITEGKDFMGRFHHIFFCAFCAFLRPTKQPFSCGRHLTGMKPSFIMKLSLQFFSPRRAFAALFFAALLPLAVHAGTPLICNPYAIGNAKSLPGGDWKGTDQSYDRTNLVRDTLALLTPDTPVIVRMETLRRAAIYATANLRGWAKGATYTSTDRELAFGLLEKLEARIAEATDQTRALALFDLGFFTETLRQTNLDPKLNGYQLLLKVAELRPNDPDVQFALALASAWPKRKEYAAHVAQASAGAKPGTLLAANLQSHVQH